MVHLLTIKEKTTNMINNELYLASQYIHQVAEQITRMGSPLPDWFSQLQQMSPTGELEIQQLSLPDFKRLILEAVNVTNDTAFGLLVGERLLISSHGLLSYVSSKSVSPKEALELIARYLPLRTSLMTAKLEHTKTHTRFVLIENCDLEEASQPVIEAITLTIKNLFEYVTMGLCKVDGVSIASNTPSHLSLSEQLFRCNVTYQASWNGFEVPHELLNIPVRASSSKALFEAVHRCQDELTRLAKSQKLSAQVRSIMLERQNNLPSLAVIARMLNLTPRTLHRRLIDEGSSYRDIIEYVRHQLAMDYLLDQQIIIKEIAFMLGYSDLASFRRAFKRWTGQTPSEYRTNSVELT